MESPLTPLAFRESTLFRKGRGALDCATFNPSPLAGEGDSAKLSGERGIREGRLPIHHELLERAKWMRANPTPAEERLWSMLRNKRMPSFKFKRQMVIAPYIVDFVCLERRLIIEADGSQHAESAYDMRRDAFFRGEGFEVLRFWNNDILSNAGGVFEAIVAALSTPHPARLTASRPSPAGGEGL